MIKKKRKQPMTFWKGPDIPRLKFKKKKKRPMLLFKPVRLNTPDYVRTINTKYLTWPQAETRYPNMSPFGDRDKDGILNGWDCKPFNKKKHGWASRGHTFNRERSSHIVMMTPDKFIRTAMKQSDNTIKRKNPNRIPETQDEYEKSVVRDYERTEDESKEILLKNTGKLPSKKTLKEIREYQEDKRKYMEKLKNVIRSRKGKMEVPFLEYDEQGNPTGHEGRHRAIAARELGVKRIPVTIARRLEEPRDWKAIREGRVGGDEGRIVKGMAHKKQKKDWRYDLENEDEVISSKSADVSIKEQREYGEEKPETLQSLKDELMEDL